LEKKLTLGTLSRLRALKLIQTPVKYVYRLWMNNFVKKYVYRLWTNNFVKKYVYHYRGV